MDGRITPVEKLKSKKIFLFGGMADKTAPPTFVNRVYDWYLNMGLSENSIYYKKGISKLVLFVFIIIIIVVAIYWVKYFAKPLATVMTGDAKRA